MPPRESVGGYARVLERRRAVSLARDLREAEDLSIAQIAERLGRSPQAGSNDGTAERSGARKGTRP
jgi:hypothetical protein